MESAFVLKQKGDRYRLYFRGVLNEYLMREGEQREYASLLADGVASASRFGVPFINNTTDKGGR